MTARRISWNGISLLVPGNWEIGVYKFLRRGVSRIELEDEYAMRMEIEWVRPKAAVQIKTILQRYEKAAKKLTRRADVKHRVSGLPDGWVATHFIFRESLPGRSRGGLVVVEHSLLTAFYLCPRSSLFCFMLVHVLPDDNEDAVEIIRQAASGFRNHVAAELIPWQLFDISFETPREFRLREANFGIGAKQMLFTWRRRRFFIWFFSCSDMILKDNAVMEEWIAGYLNGFSGIKGPVFYPGTDGKLSWRRRGRHPLGHRDELMRGCLRYMIRCRHNVGRKQLIAWVFHYRKHNDLCMIPQALRFGHDLEQEARVGKEGAP